MELMRLLWHNYSRHFFRFLTGNECLSLWMHWMSRPIGEGFYKSLEPFDSEINSLITSRKEYDIQVTLEQFIDYVVVIQDKQVDSDIDIYVRHCLRNDPELSKWVKS